MLAGLNMLAGGIIGGIAGFGAGFFAAAACALLIPSPGAIAIVTPVVQSHEEPA
jgi:hypothetical protein